MKKYILLIALVVMAQVNNAQAEAASELSLVTRQLVQELNSTLTLERSEKLARLNQLSTDAQKLFDTYLAEGRPESELVYAGKALEFIAEQQKEPKVISADEMARLMNEFDYRDN